MAGTRFVCVSRLSPEEGGKIANMSKPLLGSAIFIKFLVPKNSASRLSLGVFHVQGRLFYVVRCMVAE